jgi:hypothetical protein
VPLTREQGGGDRRVDSARHGDDYTHTFIAKNARIAKNAKIWVVILADCPNRQMLCALRIAPLILAILAVLAMR